MRIASKWALTVMLVAITAFCSFGFLASFEPPGFLAFRWLYGGVVIVSVVAILAVWLVRTTGSPRSASRT